jgi:hypothetical protein
MNRGKVARASQLDPVVVYSVQQPGVWAHHPRGGPGVDQHRLAEAGAAEQLPQFFLAGRGPDITDEIVQGPREAMFLSCAAVGRVILVQPGEASERLVDPACGRSRNCPGLSE